jgi:hypothetical protein
MHHCLHRDKETIIFTTLVGYVCVCADASVIAELCDDERYASACGSHVVEERILLSVTIFNFP